MKKYICKLALSAIVILPNKVCAYDIEVNGIYYNANVQGMTLTVTKGEKNYKGNLIIPATIEYKGKSFTVAGIGDFAFCDVESQYANQANTELLSVSIPSSVINIGHSAFWQCTSLSSVIISNGCNYIDEYAFMDCTSIESITIPNSVKSIGGGAFGGCTSLKKVILEDGDETLKANYAFDGKNITNIHLGRNISGDSFLDNAPLETATIGNCVTYIGGFRAAKLKTITIPSNVKSIGHYAFSGSSIEEMIISDSKEPITVGYDGLAATIKKLYIGRNIEFNAQGYGYWFTSVFENSKGIEEIIFGDNITYGTCESYYDQAIWNFGKCENIKTIIVKMNNPFTIQASTFSDKTYLTASLYVPYGTLSLYQSTPSWNSFFEIKEGDPTGISSAQLNNENNTIIFDINGKSLTHLQKGINIIKMSDGTTKKVLVK